MLFSIKKDPDDKLVHPKHYYKYFGKLPMDKKEIIKHTSINMNMRTSDIRHFLYNYHRYGNL